LTHSLYGWSKTKEQNDPEEQPGKKQVQYSISLEMWWETEKNYLQITYQITSLHISTI